MLYARMAYPAGMTLPNDQSMPEREQSLNEGPGHGVGQEPVAAPYAPNVLTRIVRALIRTFFGFFWSWSGVRADEVRGDGMGLEHRGAAPREKRSKRA